MKNRRGNKGFSLVEVLVTISIMAVMIGIVTPAYMSYVEKSRIAKDEMNLEELCKAVELSLTDPKVYEDIVSLLPNDKHRKIIIKIKPGTNYVTKCNMGNDDSPNSERDDLCLLWKTGKVTSNGENEELNYWLDTIKSIYGEELKLTSKLYKNKSCNIIITNEENNYFHVELGLAWSNLPAGERVD